MKKLMNRYMSKSVIITAILAILFASISLMASFACSENGQTPVSTNLTAEPVKDSTITGTVKSIKIGSGTYQWQITVRVETSQGVEKLTNRTSQKIGQEIVVVASKVPSLQKDQKITAHIWYQENAQGGVFYATDISLK
jgi:hypothetical protein